MNRFCTVCPSFSLPSVHASLMKKRYINLTNICPYVVETELIVDLFFYFSYVVLDFL